MKPQGSSPTAEVDLQRSYYARTAEVYDDCHRDGVYEPEHDVAMALLLGLARHHGWRSFLDAGAGTGRGMLTLRNGLPGAAVKGLEPVAELREVAVKKGSPVDDIVEGDIMNMRYPDAAFDCVLALGVFHHLPDPRKGLKEMLRVARKAVFISDLNNFGCGSLWQRGFSHALLALGLWRAFQWLKNGGRYWKYNEGDGVHYSYSLLEEVRFLKQQGCEVFLFSTRPTGRSLFWTCSHVAVLALHPEKKGGA